jgi:antirestriction protein ArdC
MEERMKRRREPTAEQKARTQERREKFRALVKQIAAMTDEEREAIVQRVGAVPTCEGRALSCVNTLLLISQCPKVSMVGGFRQWIRQGRHVKKGERGHYIWIPKHKDEDGEGETVKAAAEEADMPNFVMGVVFDISQTDEKCDGYTVGVEEETTVEAVGV